MTAPHRRLVVLGGSKGSHDVIRTIVADLPDDFPAPILIVTHMPGNGTVMLADTLRHRTRLTVTAAADGTPIVPGHIYTAAPDAHLIVVDGAMRLGRGPRENLSRPAIDPLFRSAALAAGPGAIGVILSGLLNDGASGLAAIRRMGGTAIVQNPAEAGAEEMPCAALETSGADEVLASGEIAAALDRLVRTPVSGTAVPPPADIRLEVEIALGGRCDPRLIAELGQPSPLSCPACSGVLSEMDAKQPLRYRCQVGHGYTAESLYQVAEEQVDEALRIALRVIEERAELIRRMMRDARESGRGAVAEMYEAREREYRGYAETLRKAVMMRLAPPAAPSGSEPPPPL